MDIREKLVEMLKEVIFPAFSGGGLDVKLKYQLPEHGFVAIADHLIANGVTVQEWIPVSDPPKAWRRENGDMINYLIYTPEFGVDIGNYAAPANCWLCVALPCKPTHWAYLPQPPKGE